MSGNVVGVASRPSAVFVAALRRRDAAAASAVYADNARLLPPASQAVVGRDQIRAFWEAGLTSGITDISFEPSDQRADGALACEAGRYMLRFDPPDGTTLVERGHYVHVHERQRDGSWLRSVEIFTPGGQP
jgi:uncharacterized protein (TIGR02246 family)